MLFYVLGVMSTVTSTASSYFLVFILVYNRVMLWCGFLWLVLFISFICIPISVFIFIVFEYYWFFHLYIYLNYDFTVFGITNRDFQAELLTGRQVLAVLMVTCMAVIVLIIALQMVYFRSYNFVQHRAGSQLQHCYMVMLVRVFFVVVVSIDVLLV